MLFFTDTDHSCSEEMDCSFIIIQLNLRLAQMEVFTYTNYVTNHDRNWYDNEHASDKTTKDIDPFNINPLKKILPRLKYRCLISMFVWRISCVVKSLKQNPAEPAVKDTLFCLLDCLSLSLCWCKLNRLMFLPHIKYSSQLDLPVCINVINYKEKTASSTLSQNNQTSWVRGEKGSSCSYRF